MLTRAAVVQDSKVEKRCGEGEGGKDRGRESHCSE